MSFAGVAPDEAQEGPIDLRPGSMGRGISSDLRVTTAATTGISRNVNKQPGTGLSYGTYHLACSETTGLKPEQPPCHRMPRARGQGTSNPYA
jgi:hypothetical protein